MKHFFFWKIVEKLARLLPSQLEKWHVFGTLARKNEMLARFWHVGTHGTRFSKLSRITSLYIFWSTFSVETFEFISNFGLECDISYCKKEQILTEKLFLTTELVKWLVKSCELWVVNMVVSCYFKKINLRLASYFLRVAVLKE